MFDFRINTKANAILCVLKGRFDVPEAEAYVAKFREGIDKMRPGFTVISDLTEYAPSDEDVRRILQDGSAYAVEKGVARGIRVVPEKVASRVSNIQMNRTARELGYEVEVVASIEEAKALLGM
ncbi:MAG: hypothetical protein AAGE01_01080 [Pseudomonadota bacterium]